MGTDIAGDLTMEQLDAANSGIRTVFNGVLPGYFNSRPVDYHLYSGVARTGGFIYLGAEARGNIRDFVEPEKAKYWEKFYRRCPPNHLLVHDMADAFPYHGIVMAARDFTPSIWGPEWNQSMEALQGIGYSIERKRDSSFARNWGQESKRELLRILRMKRIADPRTRRIVNALDENIGADAYTFARYRPRTKQKEDNWGYGPSIFSSEEEARHKKVDHAWEIPAKRLRFAEHDSACTMSLPSAAGIASPVQTSRGRRHIPMIDFRDERICVEWVRETIDKIGMRGMIVDSGNSFHFYGFETLPETEWKDFIEASRNLPMVDEHWPDLQLEQGYSMLRITPSAGRLFQPCVVETYKPAAGSSSREARSLAA